MPKESRPEREPVVDVCEKMASHSSQTISPPGIQILEQGCGTSDVYFINRGLIKLQSTDCSGRQTIVGVRRSGNLVGAEAAITCTPLLTSAITVTECCLQRFFASEFCELIRKHPDFSWHVHEIGWRELREATAALVEVKSHTASTRLKRLLLELAHELNATGPQRGNARLPFRQWEIAQMLGITPEHLSRLLRGLEKEGFSERNAIVVRFLDYPEFLSKRATKAKRAVLQG